VCLSKPEDAILPRNLSFFRELQIRNVQDPGCKFVNYDHKRFYDIGLRLQPL